MRLGIVGLPNAGKSTLFNALTLAGAAAAGYPFTTVEPNVGTVSVPDGRLDALAESLQPERKLPAVVEFVDIAGLVRGASRGEGLGNQFLGHIREVDAVVHVLRCFESPQVSHVEGAVDPRRDYEIVQAELILADLDTVERRLEKTRRAAKSGAEPHRFELLFLEYLAGILARGEPAAGAARHPGEEEALAELHLLTAKPELVVANAGEDVLPLPPVGELLGDLAGRLASRDVPAVAVPGRLAAELAELDPDEAEEFLAAVGLDATGLEDIIQASYRLLGLITFYTVNDKEVRARNLRYGATAWEAAGKVHTDMQKGFIRVEVIPTAELLRTGSFARARDLGLIRVEGREYRVQDADILYFRFSA